MSSKRKIWSIPISLALVLMLAAMVGLSSIAQAQTPPAPSLAVTNVKGAVNGDATIAGTEVLATINVENYPTGAALVPA